MKTEPYPMAIESTTDLAPNRASQSRSGSEFFYLCPPLAQRAALMLHLLAFSRQPIFVVGERGIGKTSLLEYLISVAPRHWAMSRLEGGELSGRAATVKRVLEGFGLRSGMRPVLDGPTLVQTIVTELGAHRTPVLWVDDAHKLPPESLWLLLDLALWERQAGGPHIAFFCTALIDRVLDTPETRSRLLQFAHRVELAPFTEQQTREYLVQRSAAAGREGPLPVSAAEVRQIVNRSLGVPRRINELARGALVSEDRKNSGSDGDPSAQRPSPGHGFSRAAAIVIVILAILGLWLVRQPSDRYIDHGQELVPPPINPLDSNRSSRPANGREQDTPSAEPLKRAPVQEPQTAEIAGDGAVALGLRGPEWLLAQQADRYVVQLFASRDRKAVFRFLHTHKDRLQLAWFSTRNSGPPWYAVVEGLYPDWDSARAAVAKAQSVAGASAPWPRSINSIKKTLTPSRSGHFP